MDIPGRVNDGYSNKDIRTVDLLVHIVFILSPLIRLQEYRLPGVQELGWASINEPAVEGPPTKPSRPTCMKD
jgi:hypothetical protein